jgi:hypothetical protein
VVNPDGTFAVDFAKIQDAVRSLDHELLTVEANGDYAGARKLLALGVMDPKVEKALDRLKSVPTDIEPIYVTADALAGEKAPRETSLNR